MKDASQSVSTSPLSNIEASESEAIEQMNATDEEWYEFADEVIKLLEKLDQPNLGKNNKKFYSSYSKCKWAEMTPVQKNRTKEFLDNLNAPIKLATLHRAKAEHHKNLNAESTRNTTTHKDDMARLLELRKHPAAQMLWAAAMSPMDRLTLDARHSTSTPNWTGTGNMAEAADPYGALAVFFNDYDGFTPQNRLIQYELKDGKSVPVAPARAVDPECTNLAQYCKEINPTNLERRHIRRDGAWIKEKWLDLKRNLTLCFADFNRSGRHSNEDEAEVEWLSEEECARWIRHSTNKGRSFPGALAYSYCLMDRTDFESMGKQLEPGVGRDCSVGGDGAARSSSSDHGRKRKMRLESSKSKKSRSGVREGSNLAAVLRQVAAQENQLTALQYLAGQGDREAIMRIRSIAFGNVSVGTANNVDEETSDSDSDSD